MPHPAYLASPGAGPGRRRRAAASAPRPGAPAPGVNAGPGGPGPQPGLPRGGAAGALRPGLVALRVEPLATVVAFACHAVALGSGERNASADFVAPLRGSWKPPAGALRCTSTAAEGTSTRRGWTAGARKPARTWGGPGPRAREALAGATPSPAPGEGQTVGDPGVGAPSPCNPSAPPEEAATLLAAGRERLAVQTPGSPRLPGDAGDGGGVPLRLLRLHYGSETCPEVQAEVQALRIGPLAVVALPGEIFSSLGVAIKGLAVSRPAHARRRVGQRQHRVRPGRGRLRPGGYEVDLASRYYGHPRRLGPGRGRGLVGGRRASPAAPRRGRPGRYLGGEDSSRGGGGQLALPDQLAEAPCAWRTPQGTSSSSAEVAGRDWRPLPSAPSGRAPQSGELRCPPLLRARRAIRCWCSTSAPSPPAQAQRVSNPSPSESPDTVHVFPLCVVPAGPVRPVVGPVCPVEADSTTLGRGVARHRGHPRVTPSWPARRAPGG